MGVHIHDSLGSRPADFLNRVSRADCIWNDKSREEHDDYCQSREEHEENCQSACLLRSLILSAGHHGFFSVASARMPVVAELVISSRSIISF